MKFFLLLVAASAFASAAVSAPEIDPNSATSAIALLAGGVIVLRNRSKK